MLKEKLRLSSVFVKYVRSIVSSSYKCVSNVSCIQFNEWLIRQWWPFTGLPEVIWLAWTRSNSANQTHAFTAAAGQGFLANRPNAIVSNQDCQITHSKNCQRKIIPTCSLATLSCPILQWNFLFKNPLLSWTCYFIVTKYRTISS